MMNRSIQSKRSNTVLSVTAALTCFSWAFLSAAATLPRDDHRVRAIALITNSAAGQNGEKPRPATRPPRVYRRKTMHSWTIFPGAHSSFSGMPAIRTPVLRESTCTGMVRPTPWRGAKWTARAPG